MNLGFGFLVYFTLFKRIVNAHQIATIHPVLAKFKSFLPAHRDVRHIKTVTTKGKIPWRTRRVTRWSWSGKKINHQLHENLYS